MAETRVDHVDNHVVARFVGLFSAGCELAEVEDLEEFGDGVPVSFVRLVLCCDVFGVWRGESGGKILPITHPGSLRMIQCFKDIRTAFLREIRKAMDFRGDNGQIRRRLKFDRRLS